MFYGANGHFDYSAPISQQIANLQTMKMTSYRVAFEPGNATCLTYLQNLATALKGTGITMICLVDTSMCDGNGNLFLTEAAAYQAGYQMGYACASALVPLGVNIFECGNELDAKSNIRTYAGEQGGVAVDFQNVNFPSLRGVLTGCYDGIRAVGGPSVRIASNAFTACSIACADMLWDGKQPDGTCGHTPVRWDITNWHNYEDYGNPFDGTMSMDYMKPDINLCDHLQAKYIDKNGNSLPIMFTEWNSRASDTDAQRSAWASTFMGWAYGLRKQLNLLAICGYQLYNGSPFGMMNQADGSIVQTFGTTVQSFISSNPDSGT